MAETVVTFAKHGYPETSVIRSVTIWLCEQQKTKKVTKWASRNVWRSWYCCRYTYSV